MFFVHLYAYSARNCLTETTSENSSFRFRSSDWSYLNNVLHPPLKYLTYLHSKNTNFYHTCSNQTHLFEWPTHIQSYTHTRKRQIYSAFAWWSLFFLKRKVMFSIFFFISPLSSGFPCRFFLHLFRSVTHPYEKRRKKEISILVLLLVYFSLWFVIFSHFCGVVGNFFFFFFQKTHV